MYSRDSSSPCTKKLRLRRELLGGSEGWIGSTRMTIKLDTGQEVAVSVALSKLCGAQQFLASIKTLGSTALDNELLAAESALRRAIALLDRTQNN